MDKDVLNKIRIVDEGSQQVTPISSDVLKANNSIAWQRSLEQYPIEKFDKYINNFKKNVFQLELKDYSNNTYKATNLYNGIVKTFQTNELRSPTNDELYLLQIIDKSKAQDILTQISSEDPCHFKVTSTTGEEYYLNADNSEDIKGFFRLQHVNIKSIENLGPPEAGYEYVTKSNFPDLPELPKQSKGNGFSM